MGSQEIPRHPPDFWRKRALGRAELSRRLSVLLDREAEPPPARLECEACGGPIDDDRWCQVCDLHVPERPWGRTAPNDPDPLYDPAHPFAPEVLKVMHSREYSADEVHRFDVGATFQVNALAVGVVLHHAAINHRLRS